MSRQAEKAVKILIALAVCTILLVVGAYLTWYIMASNRLHSLEQEMADQGVPTAISDISPKDLPKGENAATILTEVNELREKQQVESDRCAHPLADGGEKESESGPVDKLVDLGASVGSPLWTADKADLHLSEGKIAEARQILEHQDIQKIYALLAEAAKKPGANFDVDWHAGPNALLPHLQLMRQNAHLLACRTWVRTADGDTRGALADVQTMLKLNNHLNSEPCLISQLVLLATDSIAANTLQKIILAKPNQPFPATQVDQLQTAIIDHAESYKKAMMRAMDGERLIFGGWFYERILNGDLEAFNDIGALSRTALSSKSVIPAKLTLNLMRPLILMDYSFYLRYMLDHRELKLQQNDDIDIPSYYFLSRLILPALGSAATKVAEVHAQMDLAVIGLELQDHFAATGSYPQTLDTLKMSPSWLQDPFSNSNYRYRRNDSEIFVYSLGENQLDDNGSTGNEGSDHGKPLDIVWFAAKRTSAKD